MCIILYTCGIRWDEAIYSKPVVVHQWSLETEPVLFGATWYVPWFANYSVALEVICFTPDCHSQGASRPLPRPEYHGRDAMEAGARRMGSGCQHVGSSYRTKVG